MHNRSCTFERLNWRTIVGTDWSGSSDGSIKDSQRGNKNEGELSLAMSPTRLDERGGVALLIKGLLCVTSFLW